MLFLIGDSHARSLHGFTDDDPKQIKSPSGKEWRVLSTGGATAHGLENSESSTGAGKRCTDYISLFRSSDKKVVVTMFGDVDCIEHIRTDDELELSISRYKTYMSSLASIQGVIAVIPCSVYPRTKKFKMYGSDSRTFNDTISRWNSELGDTIDVYSSLADPDGFLPEEYCLTNSIGERHLSPAGVAIAWRTIEDCLRIRSVF